MVFWKTLAVLVLSLFAALALVSQSNSAEADRVYVAVAANFAEITERLVPIFREKTGHDVVVSSGSTGKLYAQIKHGAPFHVLLAADTERPERLVDEGDAVAGSRFTYAVGQLVLWSADPDRVGADPVAALTANDVNAIAIANPRLAPYGLAARQTLEKMGLWTKLQPKIAMGENIAQAFSMIGSGNAQIGLVAKSYALSVRNAQKGSMWPVPPDYHDPIRQDAVLLKTGKDSEAARAFLAFLRSPEARSVIEQSGYAVE